MIEKGAQFNARGVGPVDLSYEQRQEVGGRNRWDVVSAHHEGEQVGSLEMWASGRRKGEVHMVAVKPAYQRRRIATAMWNHAQEVGLDPRHSPGRTDEGEQWARAVGGRVPKRRENR